MKPKPNCTNAILLVSDITKGMKSIGSKALLNLSKNITIIDHQIQYLKKYYYPINIYICTGFEHDKIIKKTSKYKNIFYIYSKSYETDNQCHSLIQCLQSHNLDNAIVVTNGVVLLDKIPINANESSLVITNKKCKTHFDIGTTDLLDSRYLFYDLPNKWMEYVFLNKESIEKILTISQTKECGKLFLFELINLLMDDGIKIDPIIINKNLPIKVNNIKDLSVAKKYYEKHFHNKVK